MPNVFPVVMTEDLGRTARLVLVNAATTRERLTRDRGPSSVVARLGIVAVLIYELCQSAILSSELKKQRTNTGKCKCYGNTLRGPAKQGMSFLCKEVGLRDVSELAILSVES